MNEKMFARSHRAAEVIYNALAVKSNCFVKANKPVRADFVIAIDDDPTSALWASWMYHKIRAEYGYRPAVLCVGGKGLLSRHTHAKRSCCAPSAFASGFRLKASGWRLSAPTPEPTFRR